MEPRNFRAAEQAALRRDRETAYRLARQVLIENPTYVPAWLLMSTLVDDPQQQRECLERVLALDPTNQTARDRLEHLRLKELLATISLFSSVPPPPVPRKLGEYLVEQGLLTDAQLNEALAEQHARKCRGERMPLGEILLRRGLLSVHALAKALVAQQQGSRGSQSESPRRLGDYLVAEGIITPDQLEAALAEQMQLRQHGLQVHLGELLQRRGYLTLDLLARFLELQRAEFFGHFVD